MLGSATVKPRPFQYEAPEDLGECLRLLAEGGDDASLLAGGQSLIPLMNLRIAQPDLLIDINRVAGLGDVEVEDGVVRFGALVRTATAERDDRVAAALPVLGKALRFSGHPVIRNRSTVGGNVSHADSASELPAVLAALDGTVRLSSLNGERAVSWDEYFLATFQTSRRADEMLVGVDLPTLPGMEFEFDEVARRHGDFALVGACVGLDIGAGRIDAARVALFGVGSTPVRVYEAEKLLVGQSLDDQWDAELRAVVRNAIEPSGDIHASGEYRQSVAATLVSRLAARLASRSRH